MHVVRTKQFFAAALIMALSASLGWSVAANAYQTQYAVVVVLDGARICETTGDDPSLRPAYCPAWDGTSFDLIPGIWNTLAPQGSLGLQVFNTQSQPTTDLGMAAILAGKNTGWTTGKAPKYLKDPGFFEYIRKDLGLPQSAAHWFSSNLSEVTHLPWSKNRDYGASYKPDETHTGANDTATYNAFKSMLLSQRPTISLLHIWDIDTLGHLNDWEGYKAAIAIADGLVTDLWASIQADSTLSNKTALIVVNDHGRDCDPFTHHASGDSCSRQVMFLALGPDFKQNYLSMSVQDTRAITPTLGELLGAATPYSDGSVFSDIIISQPLQLMSVSVIDMEMVPGQSHKHARSMPTVLDQSGQPVAGAEVIGQWSGLAGNVVVATTDEFGMALAGSNEVTNDVGGDFVFTVTDVSANGHQYDAGGNGETQDAINTPGSCAQSGAVCTPGLSTCCAQGESCSGPAGGETCQAGPPQGQNEVHVVDIAIQCVKKGKSWRSEATVYVADETGAAMDGVAVTAQWSGADGSPCVGVTAGGGQILCQSGNSRNGGTFTLSVFDLQLPTYTYNAASDVNNPNSCIGQ